MSTAPVLSQRGDIFSSFPERMHVLKEAPVYVYRQEDKSLLKISSDKHSYLSQAKRVVLVALPFIMLYRPIGKAISIIMDFLRSFVNLTHLNDRAHKGTYQEIAGAFLQTTISVVALAGSVFAYPIGLVISTGQDIFVNCSEACHSFKKNGLNKKTLENIAHIANSSLYLVLFFAGSLELVVISFSVQALFCFYRSYDEFQKGHWLEGAGHFAMSAVRINQVANRFQSLQKKWNMMKMFKELKEKQLKNTPKKMSLAKTTKIKTDDQERSSTITSVDSKKIESHPISKQLPVSQKYEGTLVVCIDGQIDPFITSINGKKPEGDYFRCESIGYVEIEKEHHLENSYVSLSSLDDGKYVFSLKCVTPYARMYDIEVYYMDYENEYMDYRRGMGYSDHCDGTLEPFTINIDQSSDNPVTFDRFFETPIDIDMTKVDNKVNLTWEDPFGDSHQDIDHYEIFWKHDREPYFQYFTQTTDKQYSTEQEWKYEDEDLYAVRAILKDGRSTLFSQPTFIIQKNE